MEQNLKRIRDLEEEVFEENVVHNAACQLLNQSAELLTNRWCTGSKQLRTDHAVKALCPDYPPEVLETSIHLDAKVNLLDDLLDEGYGRPQMMYAIVELLRLMGLKSIDAADYFNKLIFVAISEQVYLDHLEKAQGDDVADLAVKFYLGRAVDLDIFLELPLKHLGYEEGEMREVIRAGRRFRMVDMLAKDIGDLDHDLVRGIRTPMTLGYLKKEAVSQAVIRYAEDDMDPATSPRAEEVISRLNHMRESKSSQTKAR